MSSWSSTCSGKHAAALQSIDQTQKRAHKDCQHLSQCCFATFVSLFTNSIKAFTDNNREFKVLQVKNVFPVSIRRKGMLRFPAEQKKIKQRLSEGSQDGHQVQPVKSTSRTQTPTSWCRLRSEVENRMTQIHGVVSKPIRL